MFQWRRRPRCPAARLRVLPRGWRRTEQLDAVLFGDGEDGAHAGFAVCGHRGRGAAEVLHRCSGCVHDERDRVVAGLIADGVRRAAGDWYDVAGAGRDPSDRFLVADVEGELAAAHQTDLPRACRCMTGSPSGRHADLGGTQRASGFLARREDDELLTSQGEAFGCGMIDR